jgi:Ser/Thr protein kinase RdoA (MazF antagonist)
MIDGLSERLQGFLDNNTYAWIKDIFDFNFNGYIIKISDVAILLNDDELNEIWINKSDIALISYSKKNKLKEEKNED